MQASLQQATPTPSTGSPTAHQPFAGSAWSAQPWLMAAAAVSTAVLISVAVWQRSQINDLRSQLSAKQPTQTIHPTPPATETDAPTASVNGRTSPSVDGSPGQTSRLAERGEATAHRTDTVFITRYVTIPAPGSSSQNRTAQRSANGLNDESVDRPERNQPLASGDDQQRSVTRPTSPVRNNDVSNTLPLLEPARNRRNEPAEPVTQPDRRVATVDQPNDIAEESIRTTIPSATGMATETYSRPATESRSIRRANERNTRLSRSSRPGRIAGRDDRSSTTDPYIGSTGSVASGSPSDAFIGTKDAAGTDAAAGQPTVAYEAVTSRPLTLGTIDWKTPLAYRARRMRPARTTVVGGTAAPAAEATSQPVEQVAIGFRLGAGVEVMSKLISGSALGELLVGNHLRISTGLGLASFAGGKFGSDDEFNKNNRQNFRRDYVRGIDPRNQLLNIGIHTEIVQVPLNFGYRIPLNKSFGLLPSVGTTFNLQSREHVTFEYRPPFYRSTETVSSQISRPIDLVNSLSLGTGLEWNRNHWVAQAGPVMVLSRKSTVNWQDGTSFGLRARVFYQF